MDERGRDVHPELPPAAAGRVRLLSAEERAIGRPGDVEEYLAGLPEERRAVLERLRSVIRAAAPEATEAIAYDMPAFRLEGRFLVSYAAYRHHYSLFPASGAVRDACGDALTPFLSGKGTIRFDAREPIPDALVRTIVKTRIEETSSPAEPRSATYPPPAEPRG